MTRGNKPKTITEHGASMYRQRGCRCETCCEGRRIQRSKYETRKRHDEVQLRLDPTPLIDLLKSNDDLWKVASRAVQNWRTNGIDIYWADHWCIKLGYHPAQVFGQAFYQYTDEKVNA